MNYETLTMLAFFMNVDVVVVGWRNPGRMVEPSLQVMADRGVIVQNKRRIRIEFMCLVESR